MGFNLGAFAGGAAQGVTRGMEVRKGIADAEFTEKERARKEAEWKKDDEWQKKRSAYQTTAQKYQASQEAYNKAVMENPAAAATLPKPAAPGLHDEFKDLVELTRIDVAYGKKGAEALFPLVSNLKRMEDEGLTQTLQQALAGDTQGALKTFASTGEKRDIEGIRFEPSEFDPGNGMKPIKSMVMVFSDGRRMDAAGTLWAQQQAKDLVGSVVNQQKLKNDTTRTEATVAHQNGTLGETVRHNKASEQILANKAAAGGDTTAEIKNAQAFFPDLYKENPAKALAAFRETLSGEMTAANVRKSLMNIYEDRMKGGYPKGVGESRAARDAFINERVKFVMGKAQEGGGSSPSPTPKPGDVRGGYRFKGGDPNNKASWEAI